MIHAPAGTLMQRVTDWWGLSMQECSQACCLSTLTSGFGLFQTAEGEFAAGDWSIEQDRGPVIGNPSLSLACHPSSVCWDH